MQSTKHFRRHMRDDKALGPDKWQLFSQGREIKVVADLALIPIRLCNEEVGVTPGRHERVAPFCVAGIGDDFSIAFDAQCERRCAAWMHDWISGHCRPSTAGHGRYLGLEFHKLDCKFALDL